MNVVTIYSYLVLFIESIEQACLFRWSLDKFIDTKKKDNARKNFLKLRLMTFCQRTKYGVIYSYPRDVVPDFLLLN